MQYCVQNHTCTYDVVGARFAGCVVALGPLKTIQGTKNLPVPTQVPQAVPGECVPVVSPFPLWRTSCEQTSACDSGRPGEHRGASERYAAGQWRSSKPVPGDGTTQICPAGHDNCRVGALQPVHPSPALVESCVLPIREMQEIGAHSHVAGPYQPGQFVRAGKRTGKQ
ncbi:hypothetical protein LX32DRAFT_708185 [Colletotrichum zoysiae]|uniref:Uncharacterized protein n=1 Tax=Colletotrichum zoysiae TaxID=1216348 RepID=A0AAD9HU64_9PEZI|nr:hypothetical protein LX32DRAFT_708185 [Colletotrichum zoysiae]